VQRRFVRAAHAYTNGRAMHSLYWRRRIELGLARRELRIQVRGFNLGEDIPVVHAGAVVENISSSDSR
jgi:hypothetical protein